MEWLLHAILSWVARQMEAARADYGVNPVVFLVLLFGASPVFYYSIYRMVRAVAKKHLNEVTLWSMIFLLSTAAPVPVRPRCRKKPSLVGVHNNRAPACPGGLVARAEASQEA